MKYDIELLIDVLRDYWLKNDTRFFSYNKLLSKYIMVDSNSIRIDAKRLLKYMQTNGVPSDIKAIINEYILTYRI